ncbi:MAG: NAD(P)-binding protein [bacterium]|nr:NAD(P)-binding protein [bacterium]
MAGELTMADVRESIHVIGAGPAGLAAAIELARAGRPVSVHDRNADVGLRFRGDFQGFQNWIWEKDSREVLESLDLRTNFSFVPFRAMTAYLGDGRRFAIRSERPIFYLIRRGNTPGALDHGLKQQALAAGASFCFNDASPRIDNGWVIDATGPKTANILARGMVFRTRHPDACIGVVDDALAPGGYAYFLACGGRATLATCTFGDFPNIGVYFDRALARFKKLADFDIRRPKWFSGFGNFAIQSELAGPGRTLHVGESAGFQDYLWGFGLHLAILSGHLAARSIIENRSYEELCRLHLLPLLRISLVNRWLFPWLVRLRLPGQLRATETDPWHFVRFLHGQYRPTPLKRLLYPLALRSLRRWPKDRLRLGGQSVIEWARDCKPGAPG